MAGWAGCGTLELPDEAGSGSQRRGQGSSISGVNWLPAPSEALFGRMSRVSHRFSGFRPVCL